MSGGWTGDDRATILNNVIPGVQHLEAASFRGGIGISSANDISTWANWFGTNLVAGVNIIYPANRTPPQPDSRGVIVQNNTMNGDRALGCSMSGVSCAAKHVDSLAT